MRDEKDSHIYHVKNFCNHQEKQHKYNKKQKQKQKTASRQIENSQNTKG